MVTKKQRRTQLARARAQRRSERRALREARQRRIRVVAAAVALLAAVAALVTWIVIHDNDTGSAARADAGLDYDAMPAAQPTTPIEVSR